MTKFRLGDKVRVRKNEDLSREHRWYRIWEGKEMTIAGSRTIDCYVVQENDFNWLEKHLTSSYGIELDEELFEI